MKTRIFFVISVGIFCLAIFLIPRVLHNAIDFDWVNSFQSVSGELASNEAQMETRTETRTEAQTKTQAKILFVGDMMFDRYIRKMSLRHGEDWILSCSEELLNSFDVVVGNLEGPISEFQSVSMDSQVGSPENFQFTFPTSTASLLAKYNFGIVSLGNNHINNFGTKGREQTKQYLESAGIAYFGGTAGNESIYRTTINNISFSFISFNQFGGSDRNVIANQIRAEAESGQVIVFAHWGDEYVSPNQFVKETAKLFAESGADLVIGAHPHVVLESEYIGGVPVYYSLGNFVFDQYWMEEVRNGLALSVTFESEAKTPLQLAEFPISIKSDGRTCYESEV